ncbi:MAG TPA: hypothetical protein PKD45_01795 [Flavobacteriales bacterium]|mgnify:CR=1 FL=1|nr:hypothetical protein [Flavobacteriales bacterium]
MRNTTTFRSPARPWAAVGLTVLLLGASACTREAPEGPGAAIAFQRSFTDQLARYVATGDVVPLLAMARADSLCILPWGAGCSLEAREGDGTPQEMGDAFRALLDIRTDNARFTRWTQGGYDSPVWPWGGLLLKYTITYDVSERIDHLMLTTDARYRIKAISIRQDVVNNPYLDGILEEMIDR